MRGFMWTVLLVVFVTVLRIAPDAPWLVYVGLVAVPIGWIWIWRRIEPGKRPWLKYGLIVLDAYGWVVRPTAQFAARSTLEPWIGDFGVTARDLLAVGAPILVFLALSGAFRLDPAAALFSTVVSLLAWLFVAEVADSLPRETWSVGAVIALAGVVGIFMAGALRRVALRARRDEVLERYVPSTLTRELTRSGDPEHGSRQAEVTLLMADIRGYTQRVEHLPPVETAAMLSRWHGAIVNPLLAAEAIVDDYVGDGLLAHFEGEDRAARALNAALRIRAAVARLNEASPSEPEPIRIGIAIHAGSVLIGPVGTPDRRGYGIVGDAVNVAARLEKWNKQLQSVVIASAVALDGIADPAAFGFAGPRSIEIRGHDQPLSVFFLPDGIPGYAAAPVPA